MFKGILNLSWENFYLILAAINYAIAFTMILVMVYKRRDPVKTTSWALVLILMPAIGIFLYIFFGQNHRKDKLFSHKAIENIRAIEDLSKRQVIRLLKNQYFEENSELYNYKNIIALLLNNSNSPLSENNSVEIFCRGSDTFDAIKKAFREAKDHIHLQSYIIENDKIGNEVKDLLIEKAKQGVVVRVLYDDVGSWSLKKKYINQLRKSGVEIYPFMQVIFPWLTSKINYRNHRKIIVVDGTVGFVGGMNVADRYVEGNKKFKWWRDTHLRLEGDSVKSLQYLFLLDWYFVTKQLVLTEDTKRYFPEAKAEGGSTCMQIAASGPDSDWASIMQAYFAAISKAKRYIYISTPYFMPNESIITAIKVASLSGIDVKLMLSEKSDARITQWGTMSYLSELLEAGVKIYLYRKGFNHSKTIVIDGIFTSVGSVNMDNRSFEHNFEVTAIMYDRNVAQSMEAQFKRDINSSIQVNLQQWEKRPFYNIFKEGFSRLFSPLL